MEEAKSIHLEDDQKDHNKDSANNHPYGMSLTEMTLSIDSYALLLDDFCRRTIIQWIEEYVNYLEESSSTNHQNKGLTRRMMSNLFRSTAIGLPLFTWKKYGTQFRTWKHQVHEIEKKIHQKLHQQFESIRNQMVKKIPGTKTYLLCLEYSMKIEKSLMDTYVFAKQKDTHQLIEKVLWYTHDVIVANQKEWNQQMIRIQQVETLYRKKSQSIFNNNNNNNKGSVEAKMHQMNDLIDLETMKLRNQLKSYFILQIQKSLQYIATYYQEAMSNLEYMSHTLETQMINPHKEEINRQLESLQKDAEGSELFPVLMQIVTEYHSLYDSYRKYQVAINDLTWIQQSLLRITVEEDSHKKKIKPLI
jgi:hypothetical protein